MNKDKDNDIIKEDILKLADLVQSGVDPINDLSVAQKLVEDIEKNYKIKKRDDIIDDLLNEEDENEY